MWQRLLVLGLTLACVVGGCHRKRPGQPTAAVVSASASASTRAAPRVDAGQPALRLAREGRVTLHLAPGGDVGIEYGPGGGKSRVDVRKVSGAGGQDVAVILDWPQDKLTLLLEKPKTYAEMDLGELRRMAPALERWQATNTGQTDRVADTPCVIWELTDGTYRVSTCLGQGPLRADVAVLEKAVQTALPDWARRILTDGDLPLRVTVKGAGGQTLWHQQVTEWSQGPTRSADFEIPKDYRQVAWQKKGSRAAPSPRRK
jgi:hypothetical protein